MNYVIRKRCAQKITSFYRNVSKKYKHAYSLELMEKNVHDAYDAIYCIERTLLRREPTLSRWKGLQLLGLGNPNDMTNACSYPLGRWIVMGEGEQVGSGGVLRRKKAIAILWSPFL